MAQHCPACSHGVTIFTQRFGGLIARHERKPGAGWFRYAPRRFFCPACGIEVHRKKLPLAYGIWAVLLVLFAAVMLATVGILSLGSWRAYRWDLGEFWGLAYIPLVLVQIRWGTELVSAPERDEAAPPQ